MNTVTAHIATDATLIADVMLLMSSSTSAIPLATVCKQKHTQITHAANKAVPFTRVTQAQQEAQLSQRKRASNIAPSYCAKATATR